MTINTSGDNGIDNTAPWAPLIRVILLLLVQMVYKFSRQNQFNGLDGI
jgi:hypothetical protein